jgi:hypothetical protein
VNRSQLALVLSVLAAAIAVAGVAAAAGEAPERPPRDRKPPELDISVTPAVLANPNGRLREVEISGEVADDIEIEDVFLASIDSNAPGEAHDVAGARIGSFDDRVLLRAERSAAGEGRTYRITFVAVEAAGNQGRTSATVVVPDRE